MKFGVMAFSLALVLFMAPAAWAGVSGDADGDGVPDVSDNCVDTPNPAQCNDGNTPAFGNTCDMDYNLDGTVSAADVPGFGADFGSPGPGDGNCDGTVSAADVPIFGGRFGKAPGAP